MNVDDQLQSIFETDNHNLNLYNINPYENNLENIRNKFHIENNTKLTKKDMAVINNKASEIANEIGNV